MSTTINDKRPKKRTEPMSMGSIQFETVFTGTVYGMEGLFCSRPQACFEIGGRGRVFLGHGAKNGLYPQILNFQPVDITINIDKDVDMK